MTGRAQGSTGESKAGKRKGSEPARRRGREAAGAAQVQAPKQRASAARTNTARAKGSKRPVRAPREPAGGPGLEDSPVVLPGVGPARAEALARIGVHTLRELALLTPLRLERIGPRVTLAAAEALYGVEVAVRGRVRSVRLSRGARRRSVLRVALEDDENGRLDALYFNQPWLREAFTIGAEVELYGRVVDAKGPALASPRVIDPEHPLPPSGTLIPVHRQAEGISRARVGELCGLARQLLDGQLVEPLPSAALERLGLPRLEEALELLADPGDEAQFGAGLRRLALEPLIELQARLAERRGKRPDGSAPGLKVTSEFFERAVGELPFEPTGDQARVFAELRADLAARRPMRRLLQGDVGSGKTACGLIAARVAVEAGAQVAIMAPTELLAEQHYRGEREAFARAGVKSTLLTGSLEGPARRKALAAIESGAAQVVFGTHALFGAKVKFSSLGLAVIDEQHRFGVSQRRRLLDKGAAVHVLLMTATPIPRTLALTLYGDLEVSVIAERPPGRLPIVTRRLGRAQARELVFDLDERLERGERAYWVAPRIESSEQGRGVVEAGEKLRSTRLGRHGVEVVHGRLESAERARRLARFRSGESRLLVGTTVVEVGLDIPEATVMVVEGAERLGLAQLHQLRGRVGRKAGSAAVCYLFGKASASERLQLLVDCQDGFELAEADLAARGMGDLAGLRQAGANAEGLSGDEEDLGLLLLARDLVASDAGLAERYARAAERRAARD